MSKETKSLEEKINGWKQQYGGVFELPIDDKICYLREPKIEDYKKAFIAMQNDGEVGFGETMITELWLEGDNVIKTDNDYFTPAKKEIMRMLNYDEPEIKEVGDRQHEIVIGDVRTVIRVITKEDLKAAERRNPSGKPFVTQAALYDLVKVSADPEFEDRNNATIRFPLYQAIEKVQNKKIAQLKKL
ncbi:hypothetical protein [Chryseobacterium daeguense]|uniref:hypothetical protein n=1 Tax=Chryseobacterium daeguense TaxID=412438 RepID=UPI0012DC1790|nr:hypothetical protein [Chryseobacterium daeguense]